MRGFGLDKAIKKLGIERRVYSKGKNKAILDPFQPENDSDKKIIDELQEDIFNSFKDYVLQRRGDKIADNQEEIFSGRVWSGKKACDLGLIDGVVENYLTYLQTRFGKNAKVIRVGKTKKGLIQKLGLVEMLCEIF